MKKDLEKTIDPDARLAAVRKQYRYVCKCGWARTIYPFERVDKKICKNCGRYVYVDKQSEFKDKLKEVIKNENIQN